MAKNFGPNSGASQRTGSSSYDDTLTGTESADTLTGSNSNELVEGLDGNDQVSGGSGNDEVLGGAGNDTALGGEGEDRVEGGDGNDVVDGGSGQDTILGGAGNDILRGDQGDDILQGGDGNDTLTGGSGNDIYVLEVSGDGDIITDFNISGPNASGYYDDRLDVSQLLDPSGGRIQATDVVVTDDGFGNAKLTFPMGENIILQGIAPAQISSPAQLRAAGIPCFAAGTRIETPRGEAAVEDLRPGDLVCTLDDGPQPVLWAAARSLSSKDLAAAPHLRPVRLSRQFGGNGRDLLVSPQHAMLVRHPGLSGGEALVRAAHLARLGGHQAQVAQRPGGLRYVHLMFARHQIIFANGSPSESFYPGPWGLAMLDPGNLLALARLLPGLAALGATAAYGPTARPLARFAEVQRLDWARRDIGRGSASLKGRLAGVPGEFLRVA